MLFNTCLSIGSWSSKSFLFLSSFFLSLSVWCSTGEARFLYGGPADLFYGYTFGVEVSVSVLGGVLEAVV